MGGSGRCDQRGTPGWREISGRLRDAEVKGQDVMEVDEGETIGDGAFEDYYGVRCGWDALAGQVQGGREVQERCRGGETGGAHLQVPPWNTYTPVPTSPRLAALIAR